MSAERPSTIIGVVGAGTMGSGIALTALYAGFPVVIQDVSDEILARAKNYLHKYLLRKDLAKRLESVTTTTNLRDLAGSEIVIEAAPEDLDLKRALFGSLDTICPAPALLLTNTSTLSVSVIAAAVRSPERVAGMHFFNPAPVLPLVEVIRAHQSGDDAIERVKDLARAMGKTPVVARDTPGFIVNRVARPFYGEALRLLGEGVASHEKIDHILTQGAGFRMGPFALMDLIGVDVNFKVMQSMYQQTFGEARYRPHWIQQQMVDRNALGRKTGRGFYDYQAGEEPAAPQPTRPAGRAPGVVVVSTGSWAAKIEGLCTENGHRVHPDPDTAAHPLVAIVGAGRQEGLLELAYQFDRKLAAEVPLLCQAADSTVTEIAAWLEHPERLVGFDGLFLGSGQVVTLVSGPRLSEQLRGEVEMFWHGLGLRPVWVEDSPALITPRVVCMLANEAAFALMESVTEAETLDLAMRLGVNYPLGPLEWARELGVGRVIDVLDHLYDEYKEERYRAAPLLRRWAREREIR